ncbi:MAG: type II secretion system F family protein [Planctomycetota bacterium]
MLADRIRYRDLSTLCERIGVAFDVGLNPHRVFEKEAEKKSPTYRQKMASVAELVRNGTSLGEAVRQQGNYFPSHFTEMVEAGEKSGRLELVLDRLADYYKDLDEFKTSFISAIIWPVVQLMIGLGIIALLIYLPSVIATTPEAQRDILGFGLIGLRGLAIYAAIVASCFFLVFVIYMLARGGYLNFLADWAARIPKVGRIFRVFPESRFIHTLSLAVYSGVDAWTSVAMSFRAAGTPQYLSKSEKSEELILQGQEIHKVMTETNLFSIDTLEAVDSGESSGRLAEVLDRYFGHMKNDVRKSMSWLTQFASTLIWLAISILLIIVIFRIFNLYVSELSDLAEKAISNDGFDQPIPNEK